MCTQIFDCGFLVRSSTLRCTHPPAKKKLTAALGKVLVVLPNNPSTEDTNKTGLAVWPSVHSACICLDKVHRADFSIERNTYTQLDDSRIQAIRTGGNN